MEDKVKRTREVAFEIVKDPNVKVELIELTGAPQDATNFIFWYSKVNPDEWGLTLKSIPKKGDKEGFPSQHTWKITWTNKNDEVLRIANHCKFLGADITGEKMLRVTDIFKRYRAK